MGDNRESFNAGLSDEHPVERVPVMRRQIFQRVGMLDRYGKPVEGLLIQDLAESGRDLKFSQCLLNADLPNYGCTDKNKIIAVGYRRPRRFG